MSRNLSAEFINKLDPSYRKRVATWLSLENFDDDEQENDLEEETDGLQLVKEIMFPKEEWYTVLWTYTNDDNENYIEELEVFVHMAEYQYYCNNQIINPSPKCIYFDKEDPHETAFIRLNSRLSCNAIEAFYMTFPNPNLKMLYELYKEKSYFQLPKYMCEKCEKTIDLYEKIKSVKNDEEKLFEALTETEDIDFISQNVEYLLGQDLTNKNLWKLYLNYLEEHEPFILLHTYSKYCRFWLDDFEMKEKYRKAAEKYGPIEVPWINPFNFEIYKAHAEEEYNEIKYKNYEMNNGKNINDLFRRTFIPLKYYFSSKSAIYQNLSFKHSFIHYILENSNGNLRLKFFMSCRYFYKRTAN